MAVSTPNIKTRQDLKNMLNDVYRFASKNWNLIDDIEVTMQHAPQDRYTADTGGFIIMSEGAKVVNVCIRTKAPKWNPKP